MVVRVFPRLWELWIRRQYKCNLSIDGKRNQFIDTANKKKITQEFILVYFKLYSDHQSEKRREGSGK